MESTESLQLRPYPSLKYKTVEQAKGDAAQLAPRARCDSATGSSLPPNLLSSHDECLENPFVDSHCDHNEPEDPFKSTPVRRQGSSGKDRARSSTPDSITPSRKNARFDTGESSTQATVTGISLPQVPPQNRNYFRSRRIKKEDIQRPWLERKDPREKWLTIIPLIGVFLGSCIAGFLIWDGLRSVINHKYCLVLDDDFSGGLRRSTWTLEAELGGFGNGEFEMTTQSDQNVFVNHEGLVIRPTLQNSALIHSNNIINLTKAGTCSSHLWSDCVAVTNVTNGTIVPPVKSGRVSTRAGPTIRYGRVEVTATLPEGDWLWPAIWMLPVNRTYGDWPRSGEIDIAESRGNNYTYPLGGNNIVGSTLHWGPTPKTDAWWRTNSQRAAVHSMYTTGPHIFGMEWSTSYIFTYVDNRLLQVLYFDFSGDLWTRGEFPLADPNGTRFIDPWSQTGRPSTPFDQPFYLVLNLAVGATNGWFEDGVAGKPWVDASPTAKRDFWDAQDQWYPTWANHGDFKIHRVRMWQQEGYQGCLTVNEKKHQG